MCRPLNFKFMGVSGRPPNVVPCNAQCHDTRFEPWLPCAAPGQSPACSNDRHRPIDVLIPVACLIHVLMAVAESLERWDELINNYKVLNHDCRLQLKLELLDYEVRSHVLDYNERRLQALHQEYGRIISTSIDEARLVSDHESLQGGEWRAIVLRLQYLDAEFRADVESASRLFADPTGVRILTPLSKQLRQFHVLFVDPFVGL